MFATIVTFAIVLIILVVIHELGHFVAAKLLGIKVEEFGFGLPPRIWGKKRGETIYSLNWLPIGGFVRLYGEDAEHPEKFTKEKNRAFFAKKPWERTIVLLAGVCMNFVLGWVVISYLLTRGLMVPTGEVRVEEVSPNSPAALVNIQQGDIIKEITPPEGNNIMVKMNDDLVSAVEKNLDKQLRITIDRNGVVSTVSVTPRSDHPENEGALGVLISDLEEARYSVAEAPAAGLKHTWFIITSTVYGIGDSLIKVFTNRVAQVQVAGIIGIGQIVGNARQYGIDSLLYVVAVLSVNLALINVLPFPALDGGRLAFVIYETITGKRINPQWEMYLHQIGMVILLGLMLLITINDILRIGRG